VSQYRIRNKRFVTTGKKAKSARLSAAVVLGKKGGAKGGPARARSLTSAKKSQIAKHAAQKRWGNSTSYAKPSFYKRKVR
jgi:hypothetical protein